MRRRTRLTQLADEYRAACAAMKPLWETLIEAYPNSDARLVAVTAHTAGRRRCEAARKALLEYAAEGQLETG